MLTCLLLIGSHTQTRNNKLTCFNLTVRRKTDSSFMQYKLAKILHHCLETEDEDSVASLRLKKHIRNLKFLSYFMCLERSQTKIVCYTFKFWIRSYCCFYPFIINSVIGTSSTNFTNSCLNINSYSVTVCLLIKIYQQYSTQ